MYSSYILNKFHFVFRSLIGFVVFAFIFSNLSFSATLNDVVKEQDEIRALEKERQNAIEESLQHSPSQLKQTEKITFQAPTLGETPCFNINNISLIGQDASKFNWLLNDLDAYTNVCLGVKSLASLQTNLNNRLLESGYATSRISLPDQKLTQGSLQLQLQVGRVSDFRLEDSNELDFLTFPWATWRNAVPIAKGDILNIRDLDQGLEQLKRLPSQDIGLLIEPADTENNSTLVIKRQQDRRLRGQVSLDNSGSPSFGREQLQTNITVDSPLGLNDQLSLGASSNVQNATPRHRNQSAYIYYSIPFGYSTFSTSFSYSRFGQNVQGTTVQFLSSGYSQNTEAKWHTTIMRNSDSKLGVYGALSTRRAHSYLEDVELLVQQRRTTAAELGLTYSKKWLNASMSLDTSYSVGLPWFEAESRYLDSGFSDQPTTRPKIWHGNAEFNLPFSFWDGELNYSSRLHWQTTPQQTLSIDQFSIGSRYSVRGFDGDIIFQSESGYSFRNELSITGINTLNDQLYLSPYLALDVGHLWGPSVKDSPFTSLVGTAIGIRAQTKYLYADFALGMPLYKPDGFETHSFNPMLQLTFNL
jgi:hemolysin activation/secretion protein